jgi:hypothetical protein
MFKIGGVEYTRAEWLNRNSLAIWWAIQDRNRQHPDLAVDVEAQIADSRNYAYMDDETRMFDLLRILAIDQRIAIQVKEGNPPAWMKGLPK